MAWKASNPVKHKAPEAAVELELDKLHIVRIVIQYDPNDDARTVVKVSWQQGRDEGDPPKFVGYRAMEYSFNSKNSKLMDKVTKKPGKNEKLYDAVKSAIWDLLSETEHPDTPGQKLVGPGSIS